METSSAPPAPRVAVPEVAIVITSYERPANLRRALASIGEQRGIPSFEVVVADDGSRDETQDLVRETAARVPWPLSFTTHEHDGFRPSQSRNEGVRATSAPYIVFVDGDCVMPPDHVARHLELRRPGVALAGDCLRLDEEHSRRVDEAAIRAGTYLDWAPASEVRRLAKQHRKALFYKFVQHPRRPKLIGNDFSLWRADYERVNGHDERYVGWGCEDDDLRLRLRTAGVRIVSSLDRTRVYHLWHPPAPSAPTEWKEGPNVAYFRRPFRLTRCRQGLVRRAVDDLDVRVVGAPARAELLDYVLPALPAQRRGARAPSSGAENGAARPEVEILAHPGRGRFSGRADCNVLVVLDDSPVPASRIARAHVLVCDRDLPGAGEKPRYPAKALRRALDSIY